jgi:hypothetical protein
LGMALIGQYGMSCDCSGLEWGHVLGVAQWYVWRPQGTRHSASVWDGNYRTNDGQVVTATDATALASALDRSLAAVSDITVREPEYVRWIQELITLCRLGEFRIF